MERSPHASRYTDEPLVATPTTRAPVTVIETNTEKVVATVPVGTHPQDVTWAPDGRHLYATNVDSENMTLIAADADKVTATIPPATRRPCRAAARAPGLRQHLYTGTLTLLKLAG